MMMMMMMMMMIAVLVGAGQAAVSGLSGFITDAADLEAAAALEEELGIFMNDPIYLDGNGLSRLADVPGLPVGLVESLGEYMRVFGPPHDRHELAAVESVGGEGADVLSKFVRYSGGKLKGPPADRSGRSRETRPRLTIAVSFKRLLESKRGFNKEGGELGEVEGGEGGGPGEGGEGFGGGPLAHRSRVELRLGRHVTARVATDHDAGESFAWAPGSRSYGPDFVGSSIEIVDVGPVKKMVVGDFTVRLGYGLTVWSGARRSGAGRDRPEKIRVSGIAAKTSTGEIGYLRGIGVRVGLGTLGSVEVFTSKMMSLDARDTGLHRTEREIERRERSPGVLQGGSIVFGGPRLTVGLVGTRIRISSDTTGSEFAVGIIGAFHHEWAHASIEAGRRTGAPPSWILSTYFRPSDWIEIGSRVRRQSGIRRRARVVLGADVGGAGGANPAWLTTLTLRKSTWRLHVFRDYIVGSSFSSTRWRPEVRITTGVEVKTSLQKMRVRAVMVRDVRDETIFVETGGAIVRGLQAFTTTRSKVQVDIEISRALSMHLAVAYQVSGPDETGTAVFHEIRWRPRPALNITVGVMVFETPRGAPIYAFEPDVGLQYTWSRFDGGGSRAFVLFRLAVSRGLDVRLKIGQTAFEAPRDLGSGLDHIRTDRLRTVTASIQVRV